MLKKILTITSIVLFIIAILFFQLFVINNKSLFGVKPNLILICIIVVSLWYGVYKGTMISFITGVLCDILFGNTTGMFTIAYTITGAITGLINDNYRKENRMSLVYVTFIFTALFELIQYFEYLMITHIYTNIFYFLKQVILTSLLNTVIVFIVYGVIYKIITSFEDKLKGNYIM